MCCNKQARIVNVTILYRTDCRQYRALMMNSGTPSFLVGTQDIRPHEVYIIMSHPCPNLVSTSFLYNPYIPFLISGIFFLLVYIKTDS